MNRISDWVVFIVGVYVGISLTRKNAQETTNKKIGFIQD